MNEYSNFKNLIESLEKLILEKKLNPKSWNRVVRKYRKNDNTIPSKNYILKYIKENDINVKKEILEGIKMKPTRTISGVTPVTIFTKPYRCSGNCIFCPTSENAPKSYLLEEPGIQRAVSLDYNPYEQVKLRIKALESIGHNTDKIELIISGGTWDDYDRDYQIWYISEAFRALNGLQSKGCEGSLNDLKKLQEKNETSKYRNVGISIETRPDKINEEILKLYRIFGVTKVQLGIQTLDDEILQKNTRGHSLKETYKAFELLRLAGFKIHAHWMCNLHGGDLISDYIDFKKLFEDKKLKPDEIKIYPCTILENTSLCKLFKKGLYSPYSTKDLVELLAKCKSLVPRYCRINRVFRDIPSNLIVAGNTSTNLREKIQAFMATKKLSCKCIRCREMKEDCGKTFTLKITEYETSVSKEYFLEYLTKNSKLAGFLRLSILQKKSLLINTSAIVRELHIYGVSLNLEDKSENSSQHLGLGTSLLIEAEKIVKKLNLEKISVISAVGTRQYYKKRGYMIEKKYGYALKKV